MPIIWLESYFKDRNSDSDDEDDDEDDENRIEYYE